MKKILTSIILACMITMSAAIAQEPKPATAPVVSEKRVQELKDLRWGMFICWSFSTFSGHEWTGGVSK
ncbi:MAG: hypothetical protein LBE18_11780, partial [Planctomycetaceae bacterium]|nr:hypothetical protein [Planctomycetaceae bacterium]